MELKIFPLDWNAGPTVTGPQLTTIGQFFNKLAVSRMTAISEKLYLFYNNVAAPKPTKFLLLQRDFNTETQEQYEARAESTVSGKGVTDALVLDEYTLLVLYSQ